MENFKIDEDIDKFIKERDKLIKQQDVKYIVSPGARSDMRSDLSNDLESNYISVEDFVKQFFKDEKIIDNEQSHIVETPTTKNKEDSNLRK